MSDHKKKQPKTYSSEYPESPDRCTEEIVAVDRIGLADFDTPEESRDARIRQISDYRDDNKAAPDNNLFFEERSNPLSSKGN